jgi:hypothetical protein
MRSIRSAFLYCRMYSMSTHPNLRTPLYFCAVLGFVGIFLSEYFQLYTLWHSYDTFLHFLGGIGIAWLGYAIFATDIARLSIWKRVLILVSFTTFIGVLWEFAEFSAGFAQEVAPWLWRWFRGGGMTDTIIDLAADIFGALIFALPATRRRYIRSGV